MRYKKYGIWQEITWEEYMEKAKRVVKSLIKLGIGKGDRVAIIGRNKPEWVISDMGILLSGGISVGLYQTLAPEQILYHINHSESKIIFADDEEQIDKILEIIGETKLEKVVVWEKRGLWGFKDERFIFFGDFLDLGKDVEDGEILRRVDSIDGEDVAIIIYTSGTTGYPKGAMITHNNILFMVSSLTDANEATEYDEVVSYLPLNHIAERLLSLFQHIYVGYKVNFVENLDTLIENLREIKPTIFFAVPRIWEKIATEINFRMKDSTPLKKFLYKVSLSEGKKFPLKNIIEKIVFWNIRRNLGFSRIRYALCGAAPSAPELYKFFNKIGVPLVEGYGQTESTGVISITRRGRAKIGTAGEIIKGIKVKIAEDGEILVSGPNVFKGYFKDDELTMETIKDGWLHTGDIGELDEEGFLKITDRKKDIIITSGGKNITPSFIENKLKFSPYIQDAVVIGDRRKYLVALILIDDEVVGRWADENGIIYTTFEDLTKNEKVIKLISEEVEKVNETLSQVEKIKKFALIPRKLYEEEGDITPTRKIKRKAIEKKYKDILEKLYQD